MNNSRLNIQAQELTKKYPSRTFGSVHVEREIKWPQEDTDEVDVIDGGWKIFLGHSCDEWVIGTVIEAEKMQFDLAEAINYAKSFN